MSVFAPPARRGDFEFSSILYADAGNNNRHPRASVAELAALLRPEAPSLYSKGRKPEPSTPAQDPPWHFYSAQILHYGLPFTKTKNTAKVRLLDAMNQFKLEVPAWVLKLEGELKKEWEAENRKLKKSIGTGANGKAVKSDNGLGRGRIDGAQAVNSGVNVMGRCMHHEGNGRADTHPSQPHAWVRPLCYRPYKCEWAAEIAHREAEKG
jgi:hypothetical protein